MAYTYATLSVPGSTDTQALGINNGGTIVGFTGTTTDTPVVGTGSGVTAQASVVPSGASAQYAGINNSGTIVGVVTDSTGVSHGLITTGGTIAETGAPGTAFNQLLGINNGGLAVGYSSLAAQGTTSQLAYELNTASGSYVSLDNPAHTLVLPANVNSQATGIDNSGDIVGFYMPTATTSDGFFLANGATAAAPLEYPGSTFTQALGINNDGDIVGSWRDGSGNAHGFVYTNGFWQDTDVPSATATTINGINDSGQFVGFQTTGTVTSGFESSLVNANNFTIANESSGVTTQWGGDPYTGPVAGLTNECAVVTTNTLNITADTPNSFIELGAPGTPAPATGGINVASAGGNNILDGYANSDFLTDGGGTDTDYVDTRYLTQNAWDTVVNFHSGDNVTMWGVTSSDFKINWIGDTEGAAGATGLTGVLVPTSGSGPEAAITLAGYTLADVTDGKLSFSYNSVQGNAYWQIHAA